MTGILNRLERAGFITRVPDPTDRRRVRVASVPAAVTRVVALYGPYYDRLNAQFADYSPAEIAVLNDWFTRTSTLAQDYIEELRARDGGKPDPVGRARYTNGPGDHSIVPGTVRRHR